jgi:hypothetical protein
MKKSRLLGAACAVLFTFLSLPSHATLSYVLAGKAIYDSDADLTWLADANYAKTSGYDPDGRMTWADAKAWAAGLDIDGIAGPDGWRLPDTLQPDSSCGTQSGSASYGYNCTGSEMGNLFYKVLGGTATQSITVTHNGNYDLFSNIQSDGYWSSTETVEPTSPSEYAWWFGFYLGDQFADLKTTPMYAWAVYSGNVSAIPIPSALWLFGSGILTLLGISRKTAV